MSLNNNNIKATVAIDGVYSYRVSIPATVTVAASIGTDIAGAISNATAKVAKAINPGDTSIIVYDKVGYFTNGEAINVNGSQIATCTGSQTTVRELYVNLDTNVQIGTVNAGEWVLTTDNLDSNPDIPMLNKIGDSYAGVNVESGYGISSGYYFSFSVRNLGLSDALIRDGVFFENAVVKYFIDIGDGSGSVSEWTGVIENIKTIDATSIEFKCIDGDEGDTVNIGSDKIPVCLNQNYNCKLIPVENGNAELKKYRVYDQDDASEYTYDLTITKVNYTVSSDGTKLVPIDEGLNTILLLVRNTSPWATALDLGFGLSILVSFGEGANTIYDIIKVDKPGIDSVVSTYYLLYLDKNTSSLIPITPEDPSNGKPSNLIRLVTYGIDYNLSQNAVNKVYESTNTTSKGFRVVNDDVEYFLSSPDNYTHDSKQVNVTGLRSDKSVAGKNKVFISTDSVYNNLIATIDTALPGGNPVRVTTIKGKVTLPIIDLFKLNDIGKDLYLEFDSINIGNNFSGTFTEDATDVLLTIGCVGVAGKSPSFYNYQRLINEYFSWNDYTCDITIDTNGDWKIKPKIKFKQLFFNGFSAPDVYTNIYLEFDILAYLATDDNTQLEITGVTFDNLNYVTYDQVKINKPGIGCIGQNVTTGDNQTVSDTIKYIQTELAGVPLASIDETSYNQAEADFALYPNNVPRNAAGQILKQYDRNKLILKYLEDYNLALIKNREGKWSLENWLPKSIVFSDSLPDYNFDGEWLSISKLQRGNLLKVISDIQLKFNLNESTGEYLNLIRVFNTDSVSFDPDVSVEGTYSTNCLAVLEQIFNLASAGEKRVRLQTQTQLKSDNIKSSKIDPNDGTGIMEALVSIRNKMGFLNKPIDSINFHIDIRSEYRNLDLLSFITVKDPKISNNIPWKGWIVGRKVSFEKMTYEYEIMFDINPNDPLLYRIGKLIKGNFPDILTNGNFSDKIVNGAGVI